MSRWSVFAPVSMGLLFMGAWNAGAQGKDNPLFTPDSARAATAAAGAIGVRQPLGMAGLLSAGQHMQLWDVLPLPSAEKTARQEKAEAVDADILLGVEDRAPVRSDRQNYNEFLSYNYLLVLAHKTPQKALAKGARHDVTYAHLWEEPEKYRGQIVRVEGRLRRLRKFDSSRIAAKEGVPVLYEGWIFEEQYYHNPYCVIVSELPRGIQAGEQLDYRVGFDGYFFKRYRYQAGDAVRDAPLLIGRTLTTLAELPPVEPEPTAPMLVNAFLGVLGVTALLVIGLTVWFLRGDRRVRAHLDSARDAAFVDPNESERSP
jgi:hypothetical protein